MESERRLKLLKGNYDPRLATPSEIFLAKFMKMITQHSHHRSDNLLHT
jgi:hypothetical protein